jgi:hypothetical protein
VDDLHLWGGHQPDAGARNALVPVRFVLLDSPPAIPTEVPMHWIWLGVLLTVRLRLLSLAAEPHATSGQ